MRKFLWAVIFVFILGGCSPVDRQDEEGVFLNDNQIENFKNIIKEQLQSLKWSYSEDNITFEKGTVDSNKSERYENIYNASADMGFDIKNHGGKEAVIASTKLYHFNNDDAGQAYFYFVSGKLVCEYYVQNNNVYSLKDKNVFIKKGNFRAYEDLEINREFEIESKIRTFNDYNSINNESNSIAVIDDENKLYFYEYSENKFKLTKEISFTSNNLYPIDVKFLENGICAVLLGEKDESISNSEENDELLVNEANFDGRKTQSFKSVKVAFLDKNLNVLNESIELDLSSYTSITSDKEYILLSNGKSIVKFKKENGIWNKVSQIMIKYWVTKIYTDDIDNDGKNEYIMTDGMDLYVYEFNDTLELLWKTNLSIKAIGNKIYTADLNGDGIKEIYLNDLSYNTTIKYVLSKNSFEISNIDNSEYGQKIIPGDFNFDGKDDYICINADGNQSLFLAK